MPLCSSHLLVFFFSMASFRLHLVFGLGTLWKWIKTCLNFHLIYISFVFFLEIIRYFGARTIITIYPHEKWSNHNSQNNLNNSLLKPFMCTRKKNQVRQNYSYFSVQITIHQKLKKSWKYSGLEMVGGSSQFWGTMM